MGQARGRILAKMLSTPCGPVGSRVGDVMIVLLEERGEESDLQYLCLPAWGIVYFLSPDDKNLASPEQFSYCTALSNCPLTGTADKDIWAER